MFNSCIFGLLLWNVLFGDLKVIELDPIEEKDTIVGEILTRFQCTPETCNGRGVCRFDDIGRFKCECYWQYYTGERCEIATNPCVKEEYKNSLPDCSPPPMTEACLPSYGLNNCICGRDFFGRTCSQPATSSFRPVQGAGHVVVMPLEPIAGKSVSIYIGVVEAGNVREYDVYVEGVRYTLNPKTFTFHESKSILGRFKHFIGNESITTVPMDWHARPITHLMINTGLGKVTLRATFEGKSLIYFVDYEFVYRSKVKDLECKPSIRFMGGACNTMDGAVVGSFYSQELVYERYVKAYCNSSAVLLDSNIHVNTKPYKGTSSLPERQVVAVISSSSYKIFELRQVLRIKDIFTGPVQYGTKFLMVGATREPNPKGADGFPRDSTPGWAYCWLSYLHPNNALPFMIPDGSFFWYTCKNCTAQYQMRVRTMDDPFFDEKILKMKNGYGYRSWSFKDGYDRVVLIHRCEYAVTNILDCNITEAQSLFEGVPIIDTKIWGVSASNVLGFFGSYFPFQLPQKLGLVHTTIHYKECADKMLICNFTSERSDIFSRLTKKWEYGIASGVIQFNLSRLNDRGQLFKKNIQTFVVPFMVPLENHPVLKFKCLDNCGTGYSGFSIGYSGDGYHSPVKVDRYHQIVMDTECVSFCNTLTTFDWVVNNQIVPINSFRFLNKMDPKANYRKFAIIRPETWSRDTDTITLILQIQGVKYAAWIWEFFTLQYGPELSNEYCGSVRQYGVASVDEFSLCNVHIIEDNYFINMFFQKNAEVKSKTGLLLGFSNTPIVTGVWIPTSYRQSHYNLLVYDLVSDASFKMLYSFPMDGRPPPSKYKGSMMHLAYLANMVYGKNIDITSLAFDVYNYNFFHFIQKVHFLVLELFHLSLTYDREDNVYIIDKKKELLEHTMTVMADIEAISTLEVLQMTTLLTELIFINEDLPPQTTQSNQTCLILEKLSFLFRNYTQTDEIFATKYYRISDFVEPAIDVFAALTSELLSESDTNLRDEDSIRARGNAVDELEPVDDLKEVYENYHIPDPKLKKRKELYAQSTVRAFDNVLTLLDSIDPYMLQFFCWHDKYCLGKATGACANFCGDQMRAYPTIEINSETESLSTTTNSNTYVWLEVVKTEDLFNEGRKQSIYKQGKANLMFRQRKIEPKADFLYLKVMITEGQPFWWSPSSENIIPTGIHVEMHKVEYDLDGSHRVRKGPLVASRRAASAKTNKSDENRLALAKGVAKPIKNNTFTAFYVNYGVPDEYRGGITFPEQVITYLVILAKEHPWRVTVVFDEELEEPVKVVISSKEPIMADFKKPNATVGKKKLFIAYANFPRERENDTMPIYIGVVPKGNRALALNFAVYAIGCAIWKEEPGSGENTRRWSYINKCLDSPTMSRKFGAAEYHSFGIVCTCDAEESRLFAAGSALLPRRSWGFIGVEVDYSPRVSLIVSATTALIVLVYAFLVGLAFWMDRRDTARRVPIYLISNRPGELYSYIIVVVTASEANSTTTSHVGIKLYGTLGNSKRHVLYGYNCKVVFIQRRVVWFCLNTDGPLGNIRAVELWIDNRGIHPEWKCEKLMVRDYNRMKEWVFVLQKWFSFLRNDGLIHRICYQHQVKPTTWLQKLFNLDDFYANHIYMGMLVREHCHSFSRTDKVNVAFTIIFVGAFISMFLFGIYEINLDAIADEGHVHLDRAITNGILGLLMGIVVVYPLMYFMKNGNPDRKLIYTWSDFSGLDPCEPVPIYPLEYRYRSAALVVLLGLKMITALACLFLGFNFGIRKSEMWTISISFIIIMDAFLIETVHVLMRTTLVNLVWAVPNPHRFCNEIINLYIENQKKYATSEVKKSILKRDMFIPMPTRVRRVLRQKEENFKSFKKSCKDFVFFLLLLLNNTILFHFFHVYSAYYSTDIMRRMIVDDEFSRVFGFKDINKTDDIPYFLNHTLITVTQYHKPAFMINSFVKLIGVVRLRQHKLVAGKNWCMPPFEFAGNAITRCESDFRRGLMDTRKYNPLWTPFNETTSVGNRLAYSFVYQSPRESKVLTKNVGYSLVPGGGYFVFLGRTPTNTRTLLNQLLKMNWFDNTTRFMFVDFVAYDVHSNLFNIVCLMMELSMTGDVAKYYSINTIRAMESSTIISLVQFVLFVLLVVQATNVVMRHLSQVKYCLVRIQALQDTIVMTLAFTTLGMYAFRFLRLKDLVEQVPSKRNNEYWNIEQVIMLEWWSGLTTGLWCSQNMIHLIDVFHFNPHIRIFYYTILYALDYLNICIALSCLFLVSFSCTFHFIIGQDNHHFLNFWLAYIQVFAIPFSGTPTMEFNYGTIPDMIPYIMFTFYGYSYRFLVVNLFSIVMVNSYHRARMRMYHLQFKFGIWLYIKERMLGKKIVLDEDRALPLALQAKIDERKLEKELAAGAELVEVDKKGKKGKKKKEKKKKGKKGEDAGGEGPGDDGEGGDDAESSLES